MKQFRVVKYSFSLYICTKCVLLNHEIDDEINALNLYVVYYSVKV